MSPSLRAVNLADPLTMTVMILIMISTTLLFPTISTIPIQSEAAPLLSGKSQRGKEVIQMITLEEKREKAESLARKARALGFTQTGFLLRDSYGQEVFVEGKIDELLGQYRAGDLVSIDVLLNLGRSKVRVEADRGA